MMLFMGCDPGKHGAVALLSEDMVVQALFDMPLKLNARGKEEIDALELYGRLGAQQHITLCALEAVHSMPRDGGKSAFSFGTSVGKIKAVLEILAIPTIEPSPQGWKASILRGTTRSKEAAIGFCLHRFPGIDLKVSGKPRSKKLSDDRADAVCLSVYALESYRSTK